MGEFVLLPSSSSLSGLPIPPDRAGWEGSVPPCPPNWFSIRNATAQVGIASLWDSGPVPARFPPFRAPQNQPGRCRGAAGGGSRAPPTP